MAAFRPRIGKHEMKGGHGIPRQQMFDDVGNFESQDASIRQIGLLDSSTSRAHPTEQTLDAEEVSVWILAGNSR